MALISRLPRDPGLQVEDLGIMPDITVDDHKYSDGFYPVGTTTLVPRPWNDHFTWTTEYKRSVVKWDKTNQNTPQNLTFKVVLYQGLSPNFLDSKQRFVYIGNLNRITQSARRTYIRVQDLAQRIGMGCEDVYKKDLEAFKASKARPFLAWDEGTNDISTTRPSTWDNYFNELLQRPFDINTDEDHHDRLFKKYCHFAMAATYIQKEPYSTLSRFFNSDITGIELFFRLRQDSSNAQDIAKFTSFLAQAKDRSKFKPKCTVVAYSSSTTALNTWEANKRKIGGHPLDLYTVWVSDYQYAGVVATTGIRDLPYLYQHGFQNSIAANGVTITYLNNNGVWKQIVAPIGSTTDLTTRTVVTGPRVNAARNGKRIPGQSAVMNQTSPNWAAQSLWVNTVGDQVVRDAEWLHRSAFSYGGLEERKPVASSQVVDNLILGTAATNTAMLRVEEFIKRWAVRTGGKAVVETKAIHGTADFDTIKPGWMANTLEYKFTLYQPNSTTPAYPSKTINFSTQARLTPLRLDFEVGRLFEAYVFGWTEPLAEDEFETQQEGNFATDERDD